MKRSEMVEIIIDEICNNEPISRKKKNIDFAADWILKRMEKAGMLPPTTTEKSVLPGIADFKVNKWEPEDVQ